MGPIRNHSLPPVRGLFATDEGREYMYTTKTFEDEVELLAIS